MSSVDSSPRGISADEGGAGAEEPGQPTGRPGALAGLIRLWPLFVVLLAQAVLSGRLVASNTAFIDEGTYIYSGYQELAHLLNGHSVATYESFFSGAPVIYPVLAALADKSGSLEGARLLSLVCMMSATIALYLATRRLHDSRAAFLASALFVALGPTQFLGGYATYDAMALALLAWAGYCAVRYAHGDGRTWVVLGAVLLALANCTKYASLLWNPVVVMLAVLAGPGYSAWQRARWKNGMWFALAWVAAVVLPVLMAGELYDRGFKKTTLMRKPAHDATHFLVGEVGKWIGAVVLLSLIGVVVAFLTARGRGPVAWAQAWLALVLFLAGVAAPINQIRIHTWLSLQKHVDFGAWFACIVAGALLARIVAAAADRRVLPAGVGVALVAALVAGPVGFLGFRQAGYMFGSWPDSSQLIDTLRPHVRKGSDDYLVEDYDVAAYYLKNQSNWWQWHDLVAIDYTDPKTGKKKSGPEGFKAAVQNHKYKVIVLDFAQTRTTDKAVEPVIKKSGYRLVAKIATHNVATGNSAYYVYLAPGFDTWAQAATG